jgi:hypothetical protein
MRGNNLLPRGKYRKERASTFQESVFRESRDQEIMRLSRETPKGTVVILGEVMWTRGIAQGAN